MKPLNRSRAWALLGLALVQGIAGDALLRSAPWGINLAIWSTLGIAGVAAIARGTDAPLPLRVWPWLGGALLCALLGAVNATEPLGILTLLSGVACLLLAAWTAHGGRPLSAPLMDFVAYGIGGGILAICGALGWLRPVQARIATPSPPPELTTCPETHSRRLPLRAAVGALLAIPVLVLFGGLFASADPVFGKVLMRWIDFDGTQVFEHGLMVAFWTGISAGYLRRLHVPLPFLEGRSFALPHPRRSPTVEVVTILASLTLLFGVFVAVQVRYLFGDDALIQATVGMTYAEYARKGFFELVAVAGLLLPLLLLCDWLLGVAARGRAFRGLAGALILLLAIIMASAMKRLSLYTQAYGLTELRVYAAAILLWLALVAVCFAATVLRHHRQRFAGTAILSGFSVLFALHVLDPDALVAQHNLARAVRGEEFDVDHALHLGPGAVPILWQGASSLPAEAGSRLREGLKQRHGSPTSDWRSWNLARSRAKAAVNAANTPTVSEASGRPKTDHAQTATLPASPQP
jgi:hypothetical protein